MGRTCLIISGGEFCNELPEKQYDIVIACDKGVEYARMLGLTPGYVIGDFDSLAEMPDPSDNKSLISSLFPDAEIIKLDPEKDDPDTMSAVKLAMSLGADDITVSCCMGGRLDHTLGNIQAGAYFAASGGTISLTGNNERVYIISGGTDNRPDSSFIEYSDGSRPYSGPRSYRIGTSISDADNALARESISAGSSLDIGTGISDTGMVTIPLLPGWSLSVLSVSDICAGVSVSGAKYNLTDSEMSNIFPLGISNEWVSDEIKVSVKKGILMVVCSRMPD